MTARTPVERVALALNAELVRQVRAENIELVADEGMSLERALARAALEAALDGLADFLESPTHGPLSTHSPHDGTCTECPWPVYQLPPSDLATAIRAYLLGTDEGGA